MSEGAKALIFVLAGGGVFAAVWFVYRKLVAPHLGPADASSNPSTGTYDTGGDSDHH